MAMKERVAVAAVEIPWRNIECIGVFDSFDQANEAARKHVEEYAKITDAEFTYEPINEYGETQGTLPGEDDGYQFMFLSYKEPCVYVLFENDVKGEYEIRGPFKDADDANAHLFPPKARKKFTCVAGSFSYGYYPVYRAEGTYTIIPLYE